MSATLPALRALVYVRLSSYQGENDPSTSPARQRESCEQYAAAKGWQIVDVVEDLNVSGSDKGMRLDRPGLQRVRAQLQDVDVVIFAKLDRLARNVIDFRTFADEAAGHGVALVSVAESLDLTTPSGRFVATILAAFAEMEAATIASRTAEGIAKTVELGRWRGGMPPYGYKIAPHPSGRGVGLEIDEGEAATAQRIAAALLKGRSFYSVAQELNAEGVPARRGADWRSPVLKRIVTSDASLGRMVRHGKPLRDSDGKIMQLWPPILQLDDVLRLRAMYPSKDADAPRLPRRKATRLLSRLAVCGSCGVFLVAGSSKAHGLRYRCPTKSNGRGTCAAGVNISAAELDDFVSGEALRTLGPFKIMRLETVAVDETERLELDEAIAATAQQLADPGADLDGLVAKLRELRTARAELGAAPAPVAQWVPSGETFAQMWEADDEIAARRELLSSVFAKIIVRPGIPRIKVPVADRVEIVPIERA